MSHVKFKAPEYQKDGSFQLTQYEYEGNESQGWNLIRNGKVFYRLGPGFTLVQSRYCGICATDLSRRYLPYPLPQIIGHEVVGQKDSVPVVVEINASHLARNYHRKECPYCSGGMDTQCPERITLGINVLPGGFAPYFLAPCAAVKKIPKEINTLTACLIEPFAAALHGVEVSSPEKNDAVAVLGPRRLGMLLIAALSCFRKEKKLNFTITGLIRHEKFEALCKDLGADDVFYTNKTPEEKLREKFDIVFDTTGKPGGFEQSLGLTRRIFHVKSTHGREVMHLKYLTDMVVNEIACLPYTHEKINFTWPMEKEKRENPNIFVSPTVPEDIIASAGKMYPHVAFHQMDSFEATDKIENNPQFLQKSPFPRFDLAIVTTGEEIDSVLRPKPSQELSLVRPRGAILLVTQQSQGQKSPILDTIKNKGIEIHSSRCGDFEKALRVLKDNQDILKTLEKKFITHCFPLKDIEVAFRIAAGSEESIKVMIKTG